MGIVQLAKICKQSNIHESRDDSVLSTQEYMNQVVEDVGENEDFNSGAWVGVTEYVKANGGIVSGCLGDIKTFLKNGKLEQVVSVINGVGGSRMLMEKEEIVKLVEEEEMADLELHVCGNVIEQEDLYKFDEEALDLVLEEEARELRAHEEWLENCRQQEKKDAEHERQLSDEGDRALGALEPNKAITHPVIAIFLYPLGAVKAAFALEVDAMGALDLVEVEAVRALDLMEVEVVRALNIVEVGAVGALDLVEVDAVGALDLVKVKTVQALDLVEVEKVGALDLVEIGAVGSSSSSSSLEISTTSASIASLAFFAFLDFFAFNSASIASLAFFSFNSSSFAFFPPLNSIQPFFLCLLC
nr:hypothetical protein [Tanacetum cinerariifolium]